MKFFFTIVFLVSFALQATYDGDIISSFYVPDTEANDLPAISEKFEIVRKHDRGYVVYVQRFMVDEFYKLSLDSELLEYDISEKLRRNRRSRDYSGYHNINEVYETLKELEATYSDIVKLEQYGESTKGWPLYALKVSDNVAVDEDEPELLLTAATHGDEVITVEVLLSLLKEMLSGYGSDERLSAMIDSKEMYFILVVNPDGFEKRNRYADRIDPNRDYPYPWLKNKKSGRIISSLIEYYHSRDFQGVMDFHAFGKMVMFPWAYQHERIEDHQDYENMIELAKSMSVLNRYKNGQVSKVIYIARGCSSDYYYWKTGAYAMAIEVGKSKMPRTHEIPKVIDNSREMTWRFIEYF